MFEKVLWFLNSTTFLTVVQFLTLSVEFNAKSPVKPI